MGTLGLNSLPRYKVIAQDDLSPLCSCSHRCDCWSSPSTRTSTTTTTSPPGYGLPRPFYGRPRPPIGPLGGGLDPLTFLMFQNGGLGGGSGSGDLSSILPLLLLGGGGLGGHPGKGGLGGKGGMNPLLLSSLLGKCEEPSGEECTPPNNDDGILCGINQQVATIKRCCSCTNKKSSSSLLPFLL